MDDSASSARPHPVLLAVSAARLSPELVRCLHAVHVAAVPALSVEHARDLLEGVAFDVAVVDRWFLSADPLLEGNLRAAAVPMVLVGDGPGLDDLGVSTLNDDAEPFEIALEVQRLARDLVDGAVHWGPLSLDVRRRECTWQGRPLRLTPTQFRLMATLVDARGAVVTRGDLCRRSFGGYVPGDAERLDAHLRRIRRLVEPDPSRPTFLLTVRGEGVCLADRAASDLPDPVLIPYQVAGA